MVRCEHGEFQEDYAENRVRAVEELAEKIADFRIMSCMRCPIYEKCDREEPRSCIDKWLDLLKQEATE